MATKTATAMDPSYEAWVAKNPGMTLYTKPQYREGFLWGLNQGRRGNRYGVQTKSMAYHYGYKDGWNHGVLETTNLPEGSYLSNLTDDDRAYILRHAKREITN